MLYLLPWIHKNFQLFLQLSDASIFLKFEKHKLSNCKKCYHGCHCKRKKWKFLSKIAENRQQYSIPFKITYSVFFLENFRSKKCCNAPHLTLASLTIVDDINLVEWHSKITDNQSQFWFGLVETSPVHNVTSLERKIVEPTTWP